MAYFRINKFNGIAPGVSPRLLAEEFGQVAENIDFESGRIVPIKQNTNITTGFSETGSGEDDYQALQNNARTTIFLYDDGTATKKWLEFDDDVDLVPGPIPNDGTERLYWTTVKSTIEPRMGSNVQIVSGTSGYPANYFRLGVPAASAAPSIAITDGDANTETPETRAYVYTFVTDFGEEGPPSAASTTLDVTSNQEVTVTMDDAHRPSGNYNFTDSGGKKRIYRSNTGSAYTDFQFVAEVSYGTETYADTTLPAALGEVLPSGGWIGPPDDDASVYPDGPLQGLIAIGRGVFAGFTGNRFCLSEAYLPHAWPIAYRITLEDPIVGIAGTGNGVVALTNGAPYFITGTDPAAITPIRIDLAQACVNKHSIVDMGPYVLYAAPDGLVAVSGSGGEVVSKGIVSVEQWNSDFKPTLIKAFRHEGTYVAFYNDGGSLGGWVFDPRSTESSFSTITVSSEIHGGYYDPEDGELYLIAEDGDNDRVRRYRGSSNSRTARFKSKKFVTPNPTSMAWVSVHADTYPATAGSDVALQIKVYADSTLIAHYTLVKNSANNFTQTTTTPGGISSGTLREPIMRLPVATAYEWEVEVSGTGIINEICLAQSTDEIRRA